MALGKLERLLDQSLRGTPFWLRRVEGPNADGDYIAHINEEHYKTSLNGHKPLKPTNELVRSA